jgi:hypothetical protein
MVLVVVISNLLEAVFSHLSTLISRWPLVWYIIINHRGRRSRRFLLLFYRSMRVRQLLFNRQDLQVTMEEEDPLALNLAESLIQSSHYTLNPKFIKLNFRPLAVEAPATRPQLLLSWVASHLPPLLRAISIKYHLVIFLQFSNSRQPILSRSNSKMKNSDRRGGRWSLRLANSCQHHSTLPLTRPRRLPRERRRFNSLSRSWRHSRRRISTLISWTAL